MRGEAFPNEHRWLTTAAYDEPLPLAGDEGLPAIANIWQRARAFFARVLDKTGPLDLFARHPRVRAPERAELMTWLRPVEIIARSLLLARAITWLTTTDDGAKLMSATRKRSLAERCGLPPPKDPYRESIPHPGLHTLADRNARLAAGRIDAPPPEPEPTPEENSNTLATNLRAFGVLNWRLTEDGQKQKSTATKDVRKLILSFEDLERDADTGDADAFDEDGRYIPQGLAIAARIDALGRVLENPDPAIRRIARQLASFDGETCLCFEAPIILRRVWMQGELESLQSVRWFNRCLGEFRRRIEPRPPEPG
jgi:hypothetical protein